MKHIIKGTIKRSNQSIPKKSAWILIGTTDAEDESPILWPSDANNWFIERDPDAGQDWWQMDKEAAEDEMVR